MLTKLAIRNFKRFGSVEIELGNPVVFIGPNNSGKTTALQALALWDLGVAKWLEKRGGRSAPEKRPGVTINRRDLASVPIPDANLLWRNLHVRDVRREEGRQRTSNIRIEIVVEGVTDSVAWVCGLEFDYANEESFYCRPIRAPGDPSGSRLPVPEQVTDFWVRFLPPMSGLSDREFYKAPGEIDFLIGQGRTAEVLRNLCQRLKSEEADPNAWGRIEKKMAELFGVRLDEPQFIPERSEIIMTYRDQGGQRFDLSASGRGLQQTLLLLTYLENNPGSVILLDEPDAHLEILRQRQIYTTLTEAAKDHRSQIIAASHSEVVLSEAADRDVVVAFVGQPHRIDDRGSQALKALRDIGFEDYYQAEQTGWILYLEGSTDLAILQAFARTLDHPAARVLDRPFVHYVANQPTKALEHFHGLREAKPDLAGFALFDQLGRDLPKSEYLEMHQWQRREIENYLCAPEVLRSFVVDRGFDLTSMKRSEADTERTAQLELDDVRFREAIDRAVSDWVPPAVLNDPTADWWRQTKASDDFLDRAFDSFFRQLGLPQLISKSDYHRLAMYVPTDQMDPEIIGVLDAIVAVARRAQPPAQDPS